MSFVQVFFLSLLSFIALSTAQTCQPQSPTAPISRPGGPCGGSTGAVCEVGLCCSAFGFCGELGDDDFCAVGCQSAFGDCNGCPTRDVCVAQSSTAPIAAQAGDICGPFSPGQAVCEVGLCCSGAGEWSCVLLIPLHKLC